jgi:flagellar biosynthesis regulator FlaF
LPPAGNDPLPAGGKGACGAAARALRAPDGLRIAVFYTKVYSRLLVPLTAADQAQAPPELRAALSAITRHVDDYAHRVRLPRAA